MRLNFPEAERATSPAERVMRSWVLSEESSQRVSTEFPETIEMLSKKSFKLGRSEDSGVWPFVSFSREAGAGGTVIAHKVGEALGWTVYDKILLKVLAQKFNFSLGALQIQDERHISWLDALFCNLGAKTEEWDTKRSPLSQDELVTYLCRLIKSLAMRSHAVFVGRGSQFVLPSHVGLRVRVIAPEEARVNRIMRERGMSHGESLRYIRDVDHHREKFISRFFHCSPKDLSLYDLVINSDSMGDQKAASTIVETLKCRSMKSITTSPQSMQH